MGLTGREQLVRYLHTVAVQQRLDALLCDPLLLHGRIPRTEVSPKAQFLPDWDINGLKLIVHQIAADFDAVHRIRLA